MKTEGGKMIYAIWRHKEKKLVRVDTALENLDQELCDGVVEFQAATEEEFVRKSGEWVTSRRTVFYSGFDKLPR